MIELSVVRDVVAIFGVIAGFTYYVINVRYSQRMQQIQLETRQSQLFMPIYMQYYEKDFLKNYRDIVSNWEWSDYNDFMEKYGPNTNPEAFAAASNVLVFFHAICARALKQ